MTTTMERPRTASSSYPEPPPKHGHPGLKGLFGVLLVLTAVMALVTTLVGARRTAAPYTAAALKLTPTSKLPVIQAQEGVNWTHAPAVPPPIERSGQAHLVVHWTASEFTNNLDPANGVRYAAWGFEGSVPGPMLRARVGDLIEMRLTNDAHSLHPHTIDFHFANGPGGGAKALTVLPGQTATVQMRALYPGIFMYHCATPDIPTHIANGMYGFVLIEPHGGLPHVDRELYVVQSEFYVAAHGAGLATFDQTKLDSEEPSYVVLNGAVGALMNANAPKVNVGDTVRVWYGNAGPELISSFHVIGTIFDDVYREGDLSDPPAHGIQTTLVPSGGATAVVFTLREPGSYILVDHAIGRAMHKGAVGTIVAEGTADPEIFQPGANNPTPPPGLDAHGGGSAVPTFMITITPNAWDIKNAAKAFSPNVIHIKVGQAVMWMNTDQTPHTATADNGAFDSGFINPGSSFSFTFTKAGTYSFHCTPHPWMKGTVIVS